MPALDRSHIDRLEALIRHEVEDKAIPSISYAIAGREGSLAEGHVCRSDLDTPLGPDTLFRIGSVTKTFTALAIMQQVEAGRLDLDAEISRYLPGFTPPNPFAGTPGGPFGTHVSLRKLMSHTAGIAREPRSGHYLDHARPPLAQTVAELADIELKLDPSLGVMQYSNAGIAIVGAVLEAVTGRDYAAYLRENILAPLGMADTHPGTGPGVRERLAPASMWTLDGDSPAPVFDLGGSPAGNIFATTGDMVRYMRTLLRGGFAPDGRGIVAPGSLRQMWVPMGQRPEGHGGAQTGYGLGFGTGLLDGWTQVGHGGAVYGYATQMILLPEAGLGITIFVTLDFANQIAGRLAGDGLRIALAAGRMGAYPAAPVRPPAIPSDALATLPGLYRREDAEEITEIVRRDDRLYLMGEGVPLQIRPAGGDAYVIDGRIYGRGANYAHMDLSFPDDGRLSWKETEWRKLPEAGSEAPPPEIAPHLGTYGPDFCKTYLEWRNGALNCLIENFANHRCAPVDGAPGRFRMHGLLYEAEMLELGARDDAGRAGLRVGPMFLERLEGRAA